MTELELAEQIARGAHARQKEESTGDDYIHHIERVVGFVSGDEAKTVAWLHDVVEDTNITLSNLTGMGISSDVVAAVDLLTRKSDESYAAYIRRIKDSRDLLAIAVKLADLRDHDRPSCPKRLLGRYERAWAVLVEDNNALRKLAPGMVRG